MKTQKEIIKANNKKVRKAKKQNAKKLGSIFIMPKQKDNQRYCPECNIILGNQKSIKKCRYCGSKDIVILSLGEGA